jgi:hypothetical protein
VHEDLLVLLKPGVQRIPIETDGVSGALQGVVGEQPCGAWPRNVADPKSVQTDSPAMEALGLMLINQKISVDPVDRDVILRIIRPFPHVQRPGGIEHGLAIQDGADPTGYGFDVVDWGDHLRVVTHAAPLWPRGSTPSDQVADLSTAARSPSKSSEQGPQARR